MGGIKEFILRTSVSALVKTAFSPGHATTRVIMRDRSMWRVSIVKLPRIERVRRRCNVRAIIIVRSKAILSMQISHVIELGCKAIWIVRNGLRVSLGDITVTAKLVKRRGLATLQKVGDIGRPISLVRNDVVKNNRVPFNVSSPDDMRKSVPFIVSERTQRCAR